MATIPDLWSRWQKKLASFWRRSCSPWFTRRNIPYFVLLALVAGLIQTGLPRRRPAGESDPVEEATAGRGDEDDTPFSLARSPEELAADWDQLVRENRPAVPGMQVSSGTSIVFIPPPGGRIVESRGWRRVENGNAWTYHAGIDLAINDGDPVGAMAGGLVASVAPHEEGGSIVEVDHGGGWRVMYGRLERVTVEAGATVAARDILGWPRENLLHLETWRNGKILDPTAVLGLRMELKGQGF